MIELILLPTIIGILVSIITALVGNIVVLRKMSFFGSGIGHIAFAGVGLALILGLYNPFPIVLIICSLSSIVIGYLNKKGLSEDVGIGVLFSFSMALGIILLYVSNEQYKNLMSYLFGDILAVDKFDLINTVILSSLVILYLIIFGKILIYYTFDEEFTKVALKKSEIHYYIFLILLSFVIVLAIKIVGVILLSGLLVIPSSFALMFSKNYKSMFFISPLIGIISTLLGEFISYYFDLPTGPSIVIISALILFSGFIVKNILKRS